MALRELIRSEGLESWPKVTGGKGLHVMVPIARQMTHDAAHRYTRALALRLARRDPQRYTGGLDSPRRPDVFTLFEPRRAR